MKRPVVFVLLLFWLKSYPQDMTYTRFLIDTLTAPGLHGRGYVNNGDRKAALFISNEFYKAKLDSFSGGYFQPFEFPVNVFPAAMSLRLNDKLLTPGADYIVDPASGSAKGRYKVVEVSGPPARGNHVHVKGSMVMYNSGATPKKAAMDSVLEWVGSAYGAAGIIFIEEKKLTWSVSGRQYPFPVVHILKEAVKLPVRYIKFNMESVLEPRHQTQNVIGYIKGTQKPDSFLVFSAHYDHLGRMGQATYFPGANDNASGIAMMLNLIKHYSTTNPKPAYSMVFIGFAGEEAGLKGSEFYTKNPMFSLLKIKFLINMDLLGTGDDGMMVVNGDVFKPEFELLTQLNDSLHYLKTIQKRGKAMNSDHYYFSENGVPCFFFYTLGGITAYHDIYDVSTTLPLTKFEEVFKLITHFVNRLSEN